MDHDKDIVVAVRAALAERIGQHRYELWFGSETQLQCDGTTLTLRVPNAFFQDWIQVNFRSELEAVCNEVLGISPKLLFEVESDGNDSCSSPGRPKSRDEAVRSRGRKTSSGADSQSLLPLFREEAEGARRSVEPGEGERSGAQETGSPFSAQAEPTQAGTSVVLPIPSPSGVGVRRGRSFADFTSFITGPSNQLARTSAEMVVMSPGVLSPLVFCGSTGVGKTHLMEAIWTAFRRQSKSVSAVYLAAEQFTSAYLEALRGSGLPSFRRKYRGVDVLLIDDLQFFVGKKATQVELLYTIDTLQRDGRQLVFAASAPPRELQNLEPDLVSRLDSGVVCRIEPPEYETRLEIVAQCAQRIQVRLPEEVRQFVATHFRHHARELSGAVCRLHAAVCATGEPLTVDFARQVLADMLAARQQVIQLADIRKAVCEVFQIDAAGLCGPGKSRQLSYPRMLAMWLARKYTRAALSEIGEFFGRRSHSTVISAQKQVDRWLTQGRVLRLAGTVWNPEEAIRRVEKYLRVG